ncbi:MAG: acyl-CoA-binding protein [Gammaproteobacteria bacterium]|nr:acyl-CoA-binding protein [Gammaproteobacteria bacterium]
MSDLKEEFTRAAQEVTELPRKPGNDDLLRLYAFYKQATAGDVSGKRPGFTDFAGRAKYDAWAKIEGLSEEDAMQGYINTVKRLQEEMS